MIRLARIAICGDPHLGCNDYGAHREYGKESLEYLHRVTDIVRENEVTHLLCAGDMTYGKFKDLRYRGIVESELEEIYRLTNGNHYMCKGNHDSATNGMTEYEFYVNKGLIKGAENFTIGKLYVTMLNYMKSGKYSEELFNKSDEEGAFNMVVAHDYFKFSDTRLPNYGDCVELDNHSGFYGVDLLLCGHIHKRLSFKGITVNNGMGHDLYVRYLGCMMRPSYIEGGMDESGEIDIIDVYGDGTMKFDVIEVPLWDIDKSFNVEMKAAEKEKQQLKDERVDISDIVRDLDSHERGVGNPEDVIKGIEGIRQDYKDKAIELLMKAVNQ